MQPLGWLHVNGVSLSTDIHQSTSHTSDYRSKHVTSPVPPSTPPMISSPSSVPFTTTMIEGQQNNRYYQKLENADSPKKIFIDRQIKKVKSLPGLIKGTALSHHVSLNSAANANPTDSNLPSNDNHNNSLGVSVPDNDDDSSPSRQQHERTSETRRTRVSFSDFNKVQFIEDNNESSQQSTHRRHRHRSSKKSTAMIGHNHVSPPSIQHSQTLHIPYRPSSRQQPVGQELNIKKQPLFPSPRIHSSRITQLPDILNQTLPAETSIHEKYVLQRDRGSFRVPEPATEMPINSSAEMSRESTRAGGVRSSALQDYHDQNNKLEIGDNGMNSLLNSSSMSSSLTSRQRSLRSISLRQQFMSPTRSKATAISNNSPLIATNPRRSASLKHTTTRMQSVDDDHEDINNNSLYSTLENRPMTGNNSSKQSKHNYIIHFNTRSPFNGPLTMDSNEKSRHYMKSNFHESSQERFQNVLKIVRPPYAGSINNSNNDSKLQTTMTNPNGSVRSSRTNSGHGSHEFHVASNTIYV